MSVRLWRAEDQAHVEALYGVVFGEPALAAWLKRWDWQFRRSPSVEEHGSPMWVATTNAAVVGFLASFPGMMSLNGAEVPVWYPCDLMVSSTHRGARIGDRLIRAYLEHEGNVLANALIYSPGAARIYNRLNYVAVPAQPVSLRLAGSTAVGRALARGSPGLRIAGTVAALAVSPLLTSFDRLWMPRSARDVAVELVQDAGAEFDVLWNAVPKHARIMQVRDRRWIRWRFFDDPVTTHHMWLARDPAGEPLGYVACCTVSRRNMRVGMLMDLLAVPGRKAIVGALVRTALDHLREERVDLVTVMGLAPEWRRQVKRWFPFRSRRLESAAMIKWSGDEALADLIYTADSWHLTYADGDEAFGG